MQASGSGDDGVGTVSVGPAANLYGASVALRGAGVDIDGTASVGSATIPSVSPFVSAGLYITRGLTFDSSGNLYVTNSLDFVGLVSKVTPSGSVSKFSGGLSFPAGLAFDAGGNLYVTDCGLGQNTWTIQQVTPGGTSAPSCPRG